jgi:ribonuclease Z
MTPFELHILGCGSALPTRRHLPSAQILLSRGKQFLIDCGEGTQLQFRHTHLNFNKIQAVFISHLHGDHCFGLMGLISTMGLLGRHAPLTIHAVADLEKILRPQLDYFCKELPYEVRFESFDPKKHSCIYSDRSLEVYTIPLKHRVPTAGFLFKELQGERHIRKEMLDVYQIPLKAIPSLKDGNDYQLTDGTIIPNCKLTIDPTPGRSYAYISDTKFTRSILPYLKQVDLLYHEATFCETEKERAKNTYHSTAKQAGTIAQEASVKQLLIGHFSARYSNDSILLDEAKLSFQETMLANEGLIVKI